MFLVLFYKVMASYAHIFCYFFMILATITNGGIIYMVYPALVFGIALMEEDKPGKSFWFFTLVYTQIILLVQFIA
jgi:hypothetical protein